MPAQDDRDNQFYDETSQEDSLYDDVYDDTSDTVSDEWSETSDEQLSDEGAPAEPSKKKRSIFKILLIASGVIIGLLVLLVVMGGGAKTEVTEGKTTSPIVAEGTVPPSVDATTTTNPETVAIPIPAPETQGMMDDPNILNSIELQGNKASDSTMEDVPVTSNVPTEQPDIAQTITPDVKPVSDFPTVDQIKKPEGIPEDIKEVATPDTQVAEAVPEMPEPKQAIVDNQAPVPEPDDSKLEGMESKLADAMAKITELEKTLALQKNNSSQEGQIDTNTDALNQKIATLEEKLETALRAKNSDSNSISIPLSQKSKSVTKPTQSKKIEAPKRAVQWSLKSAKSGRAILADRSTGDLKTVVIGDTVSGLGRINDISQSGSGWVVKGSISSVRE